MKTLHVYCVLVLAVIFAAKTDAQDKNNIVGLSYGFQYKAGDIWVGDPYNFWIDQTSSVIVEGFYYRKLSSLFQAGFYCDFEKGEFDIIGLPVQEAKRLGIGTIWLGHYPDKFIQFQAGGYFGYNTGFIDYESVANRGGIDYGIMVGPAIEYGDFGLAIHHHSGFAWYPKKDTEPDEFSYANTKIKIKLNYKF